MKKFTIHTMGCKSNQFESAIIKENLLLNGFVEEKDLTKSDIYILNSCSVTHKSDNEAMYLLRSVKRKKPNIVTIITGCVAQLEKEKLLEESFIDIVVGNDEKLRLGEILSSDIFLDNHSGNLFISDILQKKSFTHAKITDLEKTRASLKIQDGCNNRCSYCIIPFARGYSRSADVKFVIEQIKNFEQHGFKEIVFTGIHIGQWGVEFGKTLLDLLKVVEAETNIERYRLGSLYPNELDDEFLSFLRSSKKFCPHFHLSLQSMCNTTLERMNRKYKAEDSLLLIDKINSLFELPFIGSDIITGFAGETNQEFEETKKNLENSGLSQIHTFPYSVRGGTEGALLPNQIEESVKEMRASIVKDISKSRYKNFIERNVGHTFEVLVEKHPDKNTGLLKGITRNYITLLLDSNNRNLVNKLLQAKITDYKEGKVFGSII